MPALFSPAAPDRHTPAIPENKDIFTLFHFGSYYGRFPADGNPGSFHLDPVSLLDSDILALDEPGRTEVDGDRLLVRLDHQMDAVLHPFHRRDFFDGRHLAFNGFNGSRVVHSLV